MKTLRNILGLAVLLLAAILTTSCWLSAIKGSGIVKEEKREVGEFSGIESEISAKIIVKQGDQHSLMIEAEDNILPLIKTAVKGGTLQIESKKSFSTTKPIVVKAELKEISLLALAGSGEFISVNTLKSPKLSIDIAGSGKCLLDLNCKIVDTDIAGSGRLTLSGRCEDFKLSIAGSGKIEARELVANSVKADIAGSGNCYVNPIEELVVNVAGSGNIYYLKTPGKISQSIVGTGSISLIH